MDNQQVNWYEATQWLRSHKNYIPNLPWPGTPTWEQLSDDYKIMALADAGTHWMLQIETNQLAHKGAALDISSSLDWRRAANYLRDEEKYKRKNPWTRRS